MRNKGLETHLNSCMKIAESNLERAKSRCNEWDINHYSEAIEIIKKELQHE